MTAEKIEVVAPVHVPEEKIHRFVTSRQEWVLVASDKLAKVSAKVDKKWQLDNIVDGALVPFQGKFKSIAIQSGEKLKHIEFSSENKQLSVYLPPHIGRDQQAVIKNALIDWMRQQAMKEVQPLIEINAKKYNLYPRSCKIKTQKSRWGSCGVRNDININWLLILVPAEVMEYVVIHEICHIQERNHSARFWTLVAKHCPDYKQHRNWLKQNGHSVMQVLK